MYMFLQYTTVKLTMNLNQMLNKTDSCINQTLNKVLMQKLINLTCISNVKQTGSRNLMVPKTLPMIWGTFMKLVTKYQIYAINSCCEKGDEKYLGRTEGRTDERTDRGKSVYPPPVEWGYNKVQMQRGAIVAVIVWIYNYLCNQCLSSLM